MNIDLKDIQKWYANKINKQVSELDEYDLYCAKVVYDYTCEQLTIPAVVGRSEQLCECDGEQDLIAGTGECRKCGGQCTY